MSVSTSFSPPPILTTFALRTRQQVHAVLEAVQEVEHLKVIALRRQVEADRHIVSLPDPRLRTWAVVVVCVMLTSLTPVSVSSR